MTSNFQTTLKPQIGIVVMETLHAKQYVPRAAPKTQASGEKARNECLHLICKACRL